MTMSVHLWTADVDRLMDHYLSLGFRAAHTEGRNGATSFCILEFEGAQLLIARAREQPEPKERADRKVWALTHERLANPGPVAIYVASSALEETYERVRPQDVVEPLWQAPWGQRQFTVADPDGHLMSFFAPVASAGA